MFDTVNRRAYPKKKKRPPLPLKTNPLKTFDGQMREIWFSERLVFRQGNGILLVWTDKEI